MTAAKPYVWAISGHVAYRRTIGADEASAIATVV
jgi:hypothetical protein